MRFASPWGKTKPKKKIPETDQIFDKLDELHQNAQKDQTVLRLSLDAKVAVKIGPFSHGGRSRVVFRASDHDFGGERLTPFTIFAPNSDKIYLYFTTKVTSDFIVDCLRDFWSQEQSNFPLVTTLLINQDNGPECNSRRTQFMKRISDFTNLKRTNMAVNKRNTHEQNTCAKCSHEEVL